MADEDKVERLEKSLQQLLSLCAEQGVEVPGTVLESIQEKQDNEKPKSHSDFLSEKRSERTTIEEADAITELRNIRKTVQAEMPHLDVRIAGGSYRVTNYFEDDLEENPEEADGPRRAKQKIKTVKTESPLFKLFNLLKRCVLNKGDVKRRAEETVVMDGVNLVCEPGKMYLVLGAPGSGKSTLLKMIAQSLHKGKDHRQGGSVSITGVEPSKDVVWSNLVAYIDQIDRLHPYLTVFETCEFAWQCRSGGTHHREHFSDSQDAKDLIEKLDEELVMINRVLAALGLTRVKDTFVGGDKVRGISGGEKKRVTVAEMLCVGTPVICCDEISTGLDAATTFDITKWLGAVTRVTESIKLISLLQPPPETVALFDELILLSEGKIIYSGPIDEVVGYFNSLGYEIPERVDVADWLQALPTKDGAKFLAVAPSGEAQNKHLSTDEFVEKFYGSPNGREILRKLESPSQDGSMLKSMASTRYKNSSFRSLKLLVRRELLLWWRDKYQIRATIVKALIMGLVVGTLFWQSSSPSSLMGVLFQSMFYSVIGQMISVISQFSTRPIFYKHQDANFFPTWTYVLGRSLAGIPTAAIDSIGYGTIIYWFVGLAYGNGASIASFFSFLVLLFTTSLVAGLFFSMFSAAVRVVTIAQACMAITMLAFVLFSGFTVQPDVIPDYFIWVYWINYFAWILRSLAVNEFESGAYDSPAENGLTVGQSILSRFGFTLDDEPFESPWIWWGFLFSLGWGVLAVVTSSVLLDKIRYATGVSLVTDKGSDEVSEQGESVDIPFKRVDLTFKDIHYTVSASTSNEKLELLKGVDGIVEAGKLTALMGSSGAGKTTLMDCLAMRKTSGEITGEIRLNGHLQEEETFRRCMGYVEQFDSQSPQLTIRETLDFSARLRLDETDAFVTQDNMRLFVDQALDMLELTNVQDIQVGSDDTGGLSFEQRKRLSIAVELVANPSILFLDEPTSGLDARAASIVMRGMKRIALSGRSVCATIHQPSIAIFNDFDRLLLLKRGGETIFFGDLGENSANLIRYLEGYESTSKIQPGENPATWMLTTIGAGSAGNSKPFDYAGRYSQSKERAECISVIDSITSKKEESGKVAYSSTFAASPRTQAIAVLRRTMKVYFRSPSYNVVRLMVSGCVALLFSSVYASQRVPENESDMNSRINSIYIALLFLCVNALNSVLSLFEVERNMYYRHKAAGMYNSRAPTAAFTLAELPFILLASTIFILLFYFLMGLSSDASKFFWFYIFLFSSMATFTFTGQMLVSLFKDSQTAQGLGGLIVTFTSLFGGILIRPSEIPNFWRFMYWLMPGHYLYEGVIMSQYDGDSTVIAASPNTPFFHALNCTVDEASNGNCEGSVELWVASSFTDWSVDNVPLNIIYFVGTILATRIITFWALRNLDYRSN